MCVRVCVYCMSVHACACLCFCVAHIGRRLSLNAWKMINRFIKVQCESKKKKKILLLGRFVLRSCSSNLLSFSCHTAPINTLDTHTHTGVSLSLFGGMCCDPCRRSDAATHPKVAIRMRPRHESAKAIFLMKSMQSRPSPYSFSSCLAPSPSGVVCVCAN